ncbi:hypothetical protein QSJ18_11485 [Gordonia sp. ABSL1-1]|uniref:hypothetical protein n=1 Tax=Gordonia sp. ABSL1-1 TaxID=3053923 RepID=UPI002573DDB8|nr:hypothetical protein [Gordonia sp. ABSL1-1]MDL9937367.1 hypothetical protein [Gordonia sp. ABSL1-1]
MGDNSDSGRRDLNGQAIPAGRWGRLRSRWGGSDSVAPLSFDDEVVLVAGSDDDAIASSAALEASSWRADDEVILCHVLLVPSLRVDDAVAVGGAHRYTHIDDDRWAVLGVGAVSDDAGVRQVVLARVQMLDALHLSQERSRFAALGSRHGGTAVSWQVLQRPI